MNAQAHEVDVAIVGYGSAGITARRAAKKAGASVLVIDPGPFGTTCARVGCMPSKALIAAADAAHAMQAAPEFGVHPTGVRIDGEAVFERVRRFRDGFVASVQETVDETADADELLVGRARVTGERALEVDLGSGETVDVRFGALVLATGTRSFVPPPYRGLDLLTNETVFELARPPRSVLVVGLGAIGLELGQALHRLGARTTMLGVRGRIGPIRDPEVLESAKGAFADELDLHPEHTLESIEADGQGARVRFVDSTGAAREERFQRVLMAAGRRPTLRGLGLEALGVQADERGRYEIDRDTLQLGAAPVFVAGDANQLHPLLHEAADDGKIAGDNAARWPDVQAGRRRAPLGIVFTDPQIGIVGGGYEAALRGDTAAGGVSFARQARARMAGVNRGHLRVYAERESGRLSGAELIGPSAEHLAHLLAWSVQAGLTVEEALTMPFYHPVVEEGLRTALRDLSKNLRRGEPLRAPSAG